MFSDEVRQKFYSHCNIFRHIPIIYQTECLSALEKVIEEIKEEKSYANISDLFDE